MNIPEIIASQLNIPIVVFTKLLLYYCFFWIPSKGSVIITYKLEMKRFYSLGELTSIMTKFVKEHNNRIGLFYVTLEGITFAGMLSARLFSDTKDNEELSITPLTELVCVCARA